MKSFTLFPTIDQKLFDDALMEIENYSFSYGDDNELSYHKDNGDFILVDKSGKWSPSSQNLKISSKLTIGNPKILFGANGVCPSNSEILLGFQWSSKEAKKRDTICIDSFTIKDTCVEIDINVDIPKDSLASYVDINIIMVIGKTISKEDTIFGEEILASHKGAIIGDFYGKKLYLEGKGSEFPITQKQGKKSDPLWSLDFLSTDPASDDFNEKYVSLTFNVNHPDFQVVDLENLSKSSTLFKEIFSTALVMILIQLKDMGYLELINNNEHFPKESICGAMSYFIRVFEIDISSIDKMMYSIKKKVDVML